MLLTVLQYMQCHHLPNCTATPVGFLQCFITVPLATVTVQQTVELYNFCYHFILVCLPPDKSSTADMLT